MQVIGLLIQSHTVNKVNPYTRTSMSYLPAHSFSHSDLGIATIVFVPGPLPRSLNFTSSSQQNSKGVCTLPICVSVYYQFINELRLEKINNFSKITQLVKLGKS